MVDQREPGQQLKRPRHDLLMAGRLAELQGGVAAVFGGRLITGVELQGGKQDRQPASGHKQLPALG